MKRIILLALASFVFSNAQALDKVYVGAGGGFLIPTHDSTITTQSGFQIVDPAIALILPSVTWNNKYNNGYNLSLLLGGQLSDNFRGEVEYLFQSMARKINGHYDWVDFDPQVGMVIFSEPNNPIRNSSSTVHVNSLLANVLYDFKNSSKWTPSIGMGIGAAKVNSRNTTVDGDLHLFAPSLGVDATLPIKATSPSYDATAFAWQFKAALAYRFTDHFSIIGQYRLFATTPFPTSHSTVVTDPGVPGQVIFTASDQNASALVNNIFDLNFRYTI